MTRRDLRALADRLGIIPEYLDQTGRRIYRTSDGTREALLAIMGFDAPTEDAARGWLDELDHERRTQIVEPVRVVKRDEAGAASVRVHLPPGIHDANVQVTLSEEAGHTWTVREKVRGSAVLRLPTRVPYGYHTITAEVRSGTIQRRAEQSLIVVPSSCVTPRMLLGRRKVVGVVANLYSVRREHDWGTGDFTTFTQLVEWAASRGGAFVGVNPLHALYNRGIDVSPYSPVSRLFRNPLYIDVESVPELARSEVARAQLQSSHLLRDLRRLRAENLLDYDRVIALKERVLVELHRTFRTAGGARAREREYEDFVRAREPELTRFATWMAIAQDSGKPDWRAWPEPLRNPDSPSVRAFQASYAVRVDFHRWVQFELDRQLRQVAERARVLEMGIGVYQDLAIGTSRGGSDTWSYPDLFLTGAAIGAPPDPLARSGQNWGLPPLDPRVLGQQRYRYWVQLVRHAFEHAGALRIDHILGLFRAFWVPDGGTGKDGAYVRFPTEDLLGILALESVRHDALVVGEDLGTIPKEVPPTLKRWGILSSKVLYFEREKSRFKPAKRYPPTSLATANTHDLPTLAGFWSERDLDLRRRLGLLRTPAEFASAKRERVREKRELLKLLRLSAPPHYEESHFGRRLAGVVHEFLCSTPAELVGLSLDDLLGEVDPVNIPGVPPDRYPSWRRRTRMTMEEMRWNFEVDDTIRCTARRAR